LPAAHGLHPLESDETPVGKCLTDWPHSSFHHYVRRGMYPVARGTDVDLSDVTAGE
jgi:hypothetical protein